MLAAGVILPGTSSGLPVSLWRGSCISCREGFVVPGSRTSSGTRSITGRAEGPTARSAEGGAKRRASSNVMTWCPSTMFHLFLFL